MSLITGGTIVNVERIKIVTIETTPRTRVFETASSLTYSPVVSAGTDVELRIKNTIHGALRTEDITKGYDIELQDQKLLPEIFSLIDGGTYTAAGESVSESYAAPVAGSPVARVPFDLYAYSSDRDTDGDAIAYHEWKFPGCKGKPVKGSLKDGEFTTTTYQISNRPASGVSPMSMTRIDELPEVA